MIKRSKQHQKKSKEVHKERIDNSYGSGIGVTAGITKKLLIIVLIVTSHASVAVLVTREQLTAIVLYGRQSLLQLHLLRV
jgi:hypothetical protein